MVKKKDKKISKDTQIFIGVWIVIIIAIGIMFLIMYNPTNKISKNNNANLASENFKTIKTGGTDDGNVEIELTPHQIKNGKMVVDFLLTTHSVETKGFDLKQITRLEIGGKIFNPISAPTLSGHHNSGEIIFEVGEINSNKFKIIIEKIPAVNLREFNWS